MRAVWWVLIVGCSGGAPTGPPAWELRVDGCGWREPGVCVDERVQDPRIVVWSAGLPGDRVELRQGEVREAAVWMPALGGFAGALTLPEGLGRVEVWRTRDGVEEGGAFAVVAKEPGAPPPAAERVPKDYKTALATVLPTLGASGEAEQAAAHRQLARLAYAAGELDAAMQHVSVAAGQMPVDKRDLAWVHDVSMFVFLALEQGGDLALVRHLLEQARAALGGSLQVQQAVSWAEGLVALHVGNLRRAEEQLRQSHEVSGLLLDGERWIRATRDQLAKLHLAEGRYAEAIALFAAPLIEAEADDPCERARWHANVGYALWRASRRGAMSSGPSIGGVAPEAEPQLQHALAVASLQCAGAGFHPASDALLSTVYLNLALVAGSSERMPAAAVYADLAEAHGQRAAGGIALDTRAELALVRGEVALAAGRSAEALAAFDAVAQLAEQTGWVAVHLQALHGQARARAAAGDPEAALARYREAERVALEQARLVPITSGRDAFLAEREAATRSWVELLIGLGRPKEAMEVVRTLRAQFLDTLGATRRLEELGPRQQARWDEAVARFHAVRAQRERVAAGSWKALTSERTALETTTEALDAQTWRVLDEAFPQVGGVSAARRAPEPGEALLTWYPLANGRWAGWVATAAEARLVEVEAGSLPTEALASVLLRAVEPLLSGVERVTLLPYGPLREVDLHMVPLASGALVGRFQVAWALDTSGVGAALTRPTRAAVVSDPRGDLPWARQEGEAVRRVLGARIATIEGLAGRQATRDALLGVMGTADLLHFAGHGSFGEGVWDGELLLADEARLTIPDILASPRVPSRVVLSGCETGRTRPTPLESLGLAQAFVAAGAVAAVATVRTVDDALAAAFTEALYEARFDEVHPAQAFGAAVRTVQAADPEADVAAFRLIVP
jgi:tetratricopeptide (TPR) repeat protein